MTTTKRTKKIKKNRILYIKKKEEKKDFDAALHVVELVNSDYKLAIEVYGNDYLNYFFKKFPNQAKILRKKT